MRNRNYYIFILIITGSFLFSLPGSAAEVIDRVVAVVNDDLITQSELKRTSLSLDPNSGEQMDDRALLQKMIEQKILEQEAKRLGITVSERELDASIESVKQKFGLNDAQMEEVLAKQGMTMESFREQWRSQTLGNKLLESQLKNSIVVTDSEIKEYYEENYGPIDYSSVPPESTEPVAEVSGEEVEIAHILISAENPDALEKASQVAEMAKSGKEFAALAEEYSDDSVTSSKGGNLGYFKKGDLLRPLEAAVESTPEGGVAGPVESPAGYHIIKVLNRTDGVKTASPGKKKSDKLPIDEATKEEITQTLYRQKAEVQLEEWLEQIKENAYVEVKL